jgi:amino acid adenylation domain-containing protein
MPGSAIERTLPSAIEAVAARLPERVALRCDGAVLTYAQLDAAANRVAADVASRIEGTASAAPPIVAVVATQSLELVAAMVGVLKAGAAYLPIDPTHPVERSAGWIRSIGAAAVVHDGPSGDIATRIGDARTPLVAVGRAGDGGPPTAPPRVDDPSAPAYVYATSGSTGAPKAVVDCHRNVLHNVRRYTNSLAIGPDDRLSLVQSSTFSGAVSSLFGGLVNGSTVCLVDVRRVGPAGLASWALAERLTMFHAVPVLFRALCAGDHVFDDLRVVRLEGDAAAWSDVTLFQRHLAPGAVLVNGLGTTETGLVRQCFVDHATPLGTGGLPLGYAVPDMEVRVVDPAGDDVIAGTVGEIEVRSRYLALGYLGDPERTERAFRADPTGERRYRTGDLGRLDPDGRLWGLGRADLVDKVRGETVDLPEVERVLLAQPGVASAVVVTRRDGPGGRPRLVAYVVPSDGHRPAPETIRREMAEVLPAAAVPSVVVPIAALPLDGSSKVDRGRLPAPPTGRGGLSAGYVAPRTALERELVIRWESLLGVAPIGVQDDFFDLGGDSLDAAHLLAGLADGPHAGVADDAVLRASTIEDLARRLEGRATPAARTWFAVHSNRTNPGFFTRVGRSLDDRVGLHALGPIEGSDRRIDVEETAAAHVATVRSVQPTGPYLLAGFCFGAVVAFEMAHQLTAAGERVDGLALLAITPLEFPTLIGPIDHPGRAWWTRRWLRRHGAAIRAAGGVRGATDYLVTHARSKALRLLGRRPGPVAPGGRSGLATPFVDDVAIRQGAVARYAARPFDGPVTVVLGRGTAATYTRRPLETWAGLGRQVHVTLVAGEDHAMPRDPAAGELAAVLSMAAGAAEAAR